MYGINSATEVPIHRDRAPFPDFQSGLAMTGGAQRAKNCQRANQIPSICSLSDEQTIFIFLEFLAVVGRENWSGMKRSETREGLSLGRGNPVREYFFARSFH